MSCDTWCGPLGPPNPCIQIPPSSYGVQRFPTRTVLGSLSGAAPIPKKIQPLEGNNNALKMSAKDRSACSCSPNSHILSRPPKPKAATQE